MYALIRERTSDAQRLPLTRAVQALLDAVQMRGDANLIVSMASGYGQRVNQLDDATEDGGEVTIAVSDLFKILNADDEWFYELRVRDGSGAIAFGIVDSATVLIQADEEVVRRVGAVCSDVSIHSGQFVK